MKQYIQNRYFKIGIYVLLVIIPLTVCFKLNGLLIEKTQFADTLREQNEQLWCEYSDMVSQTEKRIEYSEELNKKLEEYSEVNSQMTDQIGKWKAEGENARQAFQGDWHIYSFYAANINGRQENTECKHIAFMQRYIYMTDDHITEEPIYTATICNREKILTELLDMGIEDKEIIDMLDSEYYVEMDFSNTYRWNRTAFPGEVSFLENAKYYPINMRTMLCFSRNNGEKVYVLNRFIWGD